MYDVSSFGIAAILFISMIAAIEFGFRIGRTLQGRSDSAQQSNTGTIQGSLLGILALLLGFTFSIALTRHDARSSAVVDEANAIGTAWLRAELLPEADRALARELLLAYTDLRVEAGTMTLVQDEERKQLIARSHAAASQLWRLAAGAAERDPNPVTTGLFLQSLNEMIDAFGRRDAALNRHVPEMVLFLLFGTFLMTGSVVGFTAGLGGHRAAFVTYIMVGLIVVLVFIIIDLDRPRRGLIQVSQQGLVELQQSMEAGQR